MKVTKIYDLTKAIEDTSNDKVIIEMSLDEYTKLTNVLYLSKLYTDVKCLSIDIEALLKQFDLKAKIKYIE